MNIYKITKFNMIMIIVIGLLSDKILFSQSLASRARGYSQIGEYKVSLLNNGIIGGAANPQGYYRGLQYLASCSFILGIPGKDKQGKIYPWAKGKKWLYDRWADQYRWYGTDTSYWGPTVSESWMDRTTGFYITDWEAADEWEKNLFGNAAANQIAPQWTDPTDRYPVLAHSNYPQTFPAYGWPGFWGWDENGQVIQGKFFSDEDIYFEMDDRFANRDVYPAGILPGYPTYVRVKVMASAFKDFPQDFILFRYRLINESNYNYKDMYAGFYFDADIYSLLGNGSYIGRTNDDDMLRLNRLKNTAYIWDLDGISGEETNLATVGIALVETPVASREIDLDGDGAPDVFPGEATGLTGWHYFDWYFRPGARDVSPSGPWTGDGQTPCSADREEIQYKIMAGDTSNLSYYNQEYYFHPPYPSQGDERLNPYFDSTVGILQQYPVGMDAVFIMSCGPFNLDAGDSTEVVMALLAAPDSTELLQYAKTAQLLYKAKYPWKGLKIISGNGGEKFSGQANITWKNSDHYPFSVNKVDLYLGNCYQNIWKPLAFNIDNSGSYAFDSRDWEDGAFYKLYIFSAGEHFAFGKSEAFFTIDNPGNSKPELLVFEPRENSKLKGITYIKWLAADAEEDSVYISINIKINGVDNLIRPFIHTVGKDSLPIDWNGFPPGYAALYFKLKDTHDAVREIRVNNLYIDSKKTPPMHNIFKHKSGNGKAFISAVIFDSSLVKDNTYQIYFSSGDTAEYAAVAIIDTVNGHLQKKVISSNIPYINTTGSVIFDGVSLTLSGFIPPKVDSTYWKVGSSASKFIVSSQGLGNPADYEIVFGEIGIDTSLNNIPVSFQLFNEEFSPTAPLDFIFIETPPNDPKLDNGDVIFIKEVNLGGKIVDSPVTTYRLIYTADSLDSDPQPGDIYRFTTLRFFSENDTLEFSPSSIPTKVPHKKEILPKKSALYQNYPNPFNHSTIITYNIQKYAYVKLTVYNMLGQKVKTLVSRYQNVGQHKIRFNGSGLASGIYFYHLSTDYGFSKTRKLLLLK